MGMYSYIQYEDLSVYNPDELIKWIKIREGKGSCYWEAVDISKEGYISLEGLSGFKIISYWYPEFIQFLTEIALFVRGSICFLYETAEEMATIHFENGTYYIDMGEMHYTKFTATEVEDIHGIKTNLSQKLIDLVMVGNL